MKDINKPIKIPEEDLETYDNFFKKFGKTPDEFFSERIKTKEDLAKVYELDCVKEYYLGNSIISSMA
jgi:hypothetical protein